MTLWPDLSVRSAEPEWMDDPAIAPEVFAALLADLERVNVWTRAKPPTLAWLAHATRDLKPGDGFSLLDVGYGRGDMLRAIHRWATQRGLVPRLSGIDLSPWSAPAARGATPPEMAIDYRTGDLFDWPAADAPDFIVSSLVAHHLPDDVLLSFLKWMETTARKGWFINDLHRHRIAHLGFGALTVVMRWHRYVRHDGMVSVSRSFRFADWARLLAEAQIADAEVRWRLPFRICVGRLR